MTVGFPAKTNFVDGNVLGASDLNDLGGTLNLLSACGRASAQNGFQNISGSVAVNIAADFAAGGLAFDSANGGGLKVAAAGTYLISAHGHLTGSANWRGWLEIRRWRDAASTVIADGAAWKGTETVEYDYSVSVTVLAQLLANDIITLRMGAADASAMTWGDSTKKGTAVQLTRVG